MSGFFASSLIASGLNTYTANQQGQAPVAPTTQGLNFRIRELEHEIQRISLLNQALWEVLQAHLNLDDKELEAKIHEVDLRDGIEDGRMTDVGLRCPKCHRVSSSKHWKCLYCGTKFKRPVMG